jgi:RNA recognition motif-containing protein
MQSRCVALLINNQVSSMSCTLSPACTSLTIRKSYFFSFFPDNQEWEGNELDDSHDSKNDVGDPTNKPIVIKDTIFITGLPKNMTWQCLFDKLKNVFITCGDIKVTEKKIL